MDEQRPLRSERPSERVMREMAEAEAAQPDPRIQPGDERSITIYYDEEPSGTDWDVLVGFLVRLRASQPLMDLDGLTVRILPSGARAKVQEAEQLRMLPILETWEHDFKMWHFADGSDDSEG